MFQLLTSFNDARTTRKREKVSRGSVVKKKQRTERDSVRLEKNKLQVLVKMHDSKKKE
jgi:hypothetical protein